MLPAAPVRRRAWLLGTLMLLTVLPVVPCVTQEETSVAPCLGVVAASTKVLWLDASSGQLSLVGCDDGVDAIARSGAGLER